MGLVGTPVRRALATLAATLALLATACSGGGDDAQNAEDLPPEHVHGLGVNPADGALYIATHTGLFRMERGSDRSERVGDSLQDTMGFAISGPDLFIGSGHPDLREDLPPLLGLIASSDGGESWDPVSLLGEADFHALRARGSLIVGYDSAGDRVMTSRDGGATWRSIRPPSELGDLVINPSGSDRVVASTLAGVIFSDDGGRSWSKSVARGVVLAWPVADRLYGLTSDGEVELSRDRGVTWKVVGDVGGEPAAVTATSRDSLIAALHDGRIVSSPDGGATWSSGAWAAAS